MGGFYITNLATPISSSDAATKGYADANFYLNTVTLDQIATATSNVSLGNHRVTSLADPLASSDAASK